MSHRGPSKHLSWAELRSGDGVDYPAGWQQTRAMKLARLFETIRHACGDVPIRVTSGYRSPEYNRRVGGVPNSQHCQGRALDLKPPKGWTIWRFDDLVRANRATWGITGYGRYRTFLHVDQRPRAEGQRAAVWSGADVHV